MFLCGECMLKSTLGPSGNLSIIVERTWSFILPVEITPALLLLLCFHKIL